MASAAAEERNTIEDGDKLAFAVLGAVLEQPGRSHIELANVSGIPVPNVLAGLHLLLRRRFIEPDGVLTGDGGVIDGAGVVATPAGLDWYRTETERSSVDLPPALSPAQVWQALRTVAKPYSELADDIRIESGELEARGIFQSGASIERARRIASRHGYRWDARSRRFIRRWSDRLRTPAVAAGGLVAVAAAFWGSLTSDRAALAVTSASTAAAAYAALLAVLAQGRRR